MAIVRQSAGVALHIIDSLFNAAAGINFDAGVAEFRSGAPPASPSAVETGVVIATVAIPADGFAAATDDGAKALAAIAGVWQDLQADAAGTIGYVRFRRAGDAGGADATKLKERFDLDVGATGSGCTIEVDNPVLAQNQQFSVTAFNVNVTYP